MMLSEQFFYWLDAVLAPFLLMFAVYDVYRGYYWAGGAMMVLGLHSLWNVVRAWDKNPYQ